MIASNSTASENKGAFPNSEILQAKPATAITYNYNYNYNYNVRVQQPTTNE